MNNKFDLDEYYKTYVTTEKVTKNVIDNNNSKNKNINKEITETKKTRTISTQTDISFLSTDKENQ